jgi:alkylhydroperoxidase/carboxymuconolactone decarboxylase family protein YurZ
MIPQASDATSTARESEPTQRRAEVRLQDLIPIVMVIVGGCEPCAEKTVGRALQDGSSSQDVDRTLRIVEHMQGLDCFAKAVGGEVLERMEKPLAAGRRTLEAMQRASVCTTDCGCS